MRSNYLIFNDNSYLSEYLHSYGMVVGFGFTLYAIIEGLDCGCCIYRRRVSGARRSTLLAPVSNMKM